MHGAYNRGSRFDVFKYMLKSYKDLPFSDIYLFILLDDEFKYLQNSLTEYIYSTFSNLDINKIQITYDRYIKQLQWIPVITQLVEKHGMNELVWFSQNDDHIFVDFNMDILNEGLELLKNEPSAHKSISFSHWPESIKCAGKFQAQIVNNYLAFNMTTFCSIQIMNLQYLYFIFVEHPWNQDHVRIDFLILDFTSTPDADDPLQQKIYVPLREMVRHFDGYDHVQMDRSACPPLVLPSNTFSYTPQALMKKMQAQHTCSNMDFQIPLEWIIKNLNLHPPNLLEHTV